MNLSIDRTDGIAIVRVGETKLMYPLLSTFAESITTLLANGESNVIIDMSQLIYVDSASIGCLLDLYRQASQVGGALKLAGVQKFIELHPDESSAVKSLTG